MKVLQVISSISAARGGPSTALRNLVKALHTQGIRTDIATTDDDGVGETKTISPGNFLPVEGGRVIYFRKQTEFYAMSLPLLAWLRSHARDYDLLHVHGLFNFAATVGALSAAMSKVPYVLTPHGTLNNWGRLNRRPKLKTASLCLLESRMLRLASMIHFTSDVEQLEADNVVSNTSTVVPLGLDINSLTEPTREVNTNITVDSPDTSHGILFLSRIDRIKNLDILLHAMRQVADVCPSAILFIAGDGEAGLVGELQSLGRQLGLEHRLRWLGFVSGSRKKWLLDNCTLLAMPSQSENFGLAAVEAMAHGMPAIVTPGVGLASMIERYGAGMVCQVDAQQLASAILVYLTDATPRQHASRAARQLVRNELTLEVFGQRMLHMYEQVLAGNGQLIDAHSCALPPGVAE